MKEQSTMELIFQIVNAVGSFATFLAFLFLFKKDKDKQNQIDKLTSIAAILENQAGSLQRQNDLIAQQVDIFRNTSILRGKDDDAMLRLRQIEEKKLKLSVMPNLWVNGAGYRGGSTRLQIDLNNKGEKALLQEFELKSEDIILLRKDLPYELEKGDRRYIFASPIGHKDVNDCEYEVDVIYLDALKNKYLSKIRGKGISVDIVDTIEIEQ